LRSTGRCGKASASARLFAFGQACGAFHQRVSSGRDRFAPARQRASRQMCQQGCLGITCMNRTRARFCPATRWCSRAVRSARGQRPSRRFSTLAGSAESAEGVAQRRHPEMGRSSPAASAPAPTKCRPACCHARAGAGGLPRSQDDRGATPHSISNRGEETREIRVTHYYGFKLNVGAAFERAFGLSPNSRLIYIVRDPRDVVASQIERWLCLSGSFTRCMRPS
jgi:hypothetical protein